jgi:hypothetical protein
VCVCPFTNPTSGFIGSAPCQPDRHVILQAFPEVQNWEGPMVPDQE